MDDTTIEESLQTIIDDDHGTISSLHAAAEDSEQQQERPTADESAANEAVVEHHGDTVDTAESSSSTKPKRTRSKRERRVVVPGSAADFRRREANRMAADRSRIRASEKRIGLLGTSKTLTTENDRLKAEIAKLESQMPISMAHSHGHPHAEDQHPHQIHQDMHHNATSSGNEAQDSHSRHILAALMSAGSVNEAFGGADGDDESWMKGVEDMFKEAEKSGRLGELAALATTGRNPAVDGEDGEDGEGEQEGANREAASEEDGQNGDVAMTDLSNFSEHASQAGTTQAEQSQPDQITAEVDQSDETATSQSFVASRIEYSPVHAASRTSSAMAVLINAEMEKILRDDLAATKAAIAKIDKELIRVKAIQAGEIAEEDVQGDRCEERKLGLSDDMLATESAKLKATASTAQDTNMKLEKDLPGWRESVKHAKEDKLDQENKLASAVEDLQDFASERPAEERQAIVSVLKSLTGYIGSLVIGSSNDGTEGGVNTTSSAFSSPALARRKRGRPPKPSNGQSEDADATSSEHLPSTLAQSFTAEDLASVARAVTHLPKSKISASTNPKYRLLQKLSDAHYNTQHTATTDETPAAAPEGETPAEPVQPTPEQYILSHLQESTNFGEYLPRASGETDPDGSRLSAQGGPGDAEAQTTETANAAAGTADASVTEVPPSVLSRLKKGPPGSCEICTRTETSVWRKLPIAGGVVLKVCNACGLYHTKFGVIRPPELWGDGISLKKRKAATPRAPRVKPDGAASKPKSKKRKRTKGAKGDEAKGDEENTAMDDSQDNNLTLGDATNDEEVGSAGQAELEEEEEQVEERAEEENVQHGIESSLDETFEGLDGGQMASMLGIGPTEVV